MYAHDYTRLVTPRSSARSTVVLNLLVKQKTGRKVNSVNLCQNARLELKDAHRRAPGRTGTQHEADVMIVTEDRGRKKAGLRQNPKTTEQILFWAPPGHHH
jgi:hypothetical protein